MFEFALKILQEKKKKRRGILVRIQAGDKSHTMYCNGEFNKELLTRTLTGRENL